MPVCVNKLMLTHMTGMRTHQEARRRIMARHCLDRGCASSLGIPYTNRSPVRLIMGDKEILRRAMTRVLDGTYSGIYRSISDIARLEIKYMCPVVHEHGEHTRI